MRDGCGEDEYSVWVMRGSDSRNNELFSNNLKINSLEMFQLSEKPSAESQLSFEIVSKDEFDSPSPDFMSKHIS